MPWTLDNLGRPNQPEVTGTNIPLLSTVLAGFAITITAGLFTRSDAHLASPTSNHPLIAALTLLAVSVPIFVKATTFGMWGQSYKYLEMTPEELTVLNVTGESQRNYVDRLFRRWFLWHRAAVLAFYLGTCLFLLGVLILLAIFIGRPVAAWFVGVSILCIAATGALWYWDRNKLT